MPKMCTVLGLDSSASDQSFLVYTRWQRMAKLILLRFHQNRVSSPAMGALEKINRFLPFESNEVELSCSANFGSFP